MRSGLKNVGLDHHSEVTVATIRNASRKILGRCVLTTEEEAILELFRGLRGTIRVAFEEGTQAQWLHDLLEPVVDEVIVCDRRGERRRGNKGDHLDADEISDLLAQDSLRAVYHGSPHGADLRELTRTYLNLVQDSTRAMQRLKALFRARSIRTPGKAVYQPEKRKEWLQRLTNRGVRFRAEALYAELDLMRTLRRRAKAAMLTEARRDPAWSVLQSVPSLGPVRAAVLLAVLRTPWRFRTKRNLWGFAGLAVVTHTSSDYTLVNGRPVRRKRPPLTRGLNRNHNPIVKAIFRSAGVDASHRPGPFQDLYQGMLARGMEPRLAQLTLARKLAAVTLHVWKKGEVFDPAKLIGPGPTA